MSEEDEAMKVKICVYDRCPTLMHLNAINQSLRRWCVGLRYACLVYHGQVYLGFISGYSYSYHKGIAIVLLWMAIRRIRGSDSYKNLFFF